MSDYEAPDDSEKAEQFLIRATICAVDRVDENEIRRLIEYLGGTAAPHGYTFPTAERRSAALEVLSDKYGSRCFGC